LPEIFLILPLLPPQMRGYFSPDDGASPVSDREMTAHFWNNLQKTDACAAVKIFLIIIL
jgi:hypothetical protein